jgi:DNA-directed RNA polymerase subunit K/omega
LDTYSNVNPVVVRMQESAKGSIYQSIVAMGIRARQINDNIRTEIQSKLADVITDTSESEGTNYDQMAVSREFDYLQKPTFIAMREVLDHKLSFELPVVQTSTDEDDE